MTFIRFVRWLFGIEAPRISRDNAADIARKECERRGLLTGQVRVIEQWRTWLVLADWSRVGAPRILIDKQTGKVIKVSYLPR